jgi:hypothetical protein
METGIQPMPARPSAARTLWVMYRCHRSVARLLAMRATDRRLPPTRIARRGPMRSARAPASTPEMPYRMANSEKIPAVEA